MIPEPLRASHEARVDEHTILEPLATESSSCNCHHTCILEVQVVVGVGKVFELLLRAASVRLADVELMGVMECAISDHEQDRECEDPGED